MKKQWPTQQLRGAFYFLIQIPALHLQPPTPKLRISSPDPGPQSPFSLWLLRLTLSGRLTNGSHSVTSVENNMPQ